jgi:acyl-homoserine lactone acylase PvdQ
VGINNRVGRSGRDPHYRGLFEYWARGKYFPVLFSRAKVESVAEHRLVGATLTAPQCHKYD